MFFLTNYLDLFEIFERELKVNFDLNDHIFVIHYLFIPQINEALSNFQLSWNAHRLSTERNLSPTQLFYRHVDVVGEQQIEDDYGAEEGGADDGNFVLQTDDQYMNLNAGANLESVNCSLNNEQMQLFRDMVSPISY